jgi:hypothetical protein
MRPTSACLALLLLTALPALAGPGAFVSDVRVDAVEQPESTRVVFTVEAGTSYPLLKKGGPNRAWCKLRGPSAEGWVLCEGAPESTVARAPDAAALVAADRANSEQQARFAAGGDEERAAPVQAVSGGAKGSAAVSTAGWTPATGCATTCNRAPLFSKPPALTPLDREVLDMCPARPDVSVSTGDVQRFFARHLSDARIQTALSAAGRPGSRQGNIEWLTSLWTGSGPKNAFTHVFCGDDWSRGPIGGLHFLPRYAQLEAEGKLCYQGPARGGVAERGGQYLIRFRGVAPWSCGEKKIGGFSRTPDAVGLVAVGTRAFVRCCARDGGKKEGGVYSAKDLGGTNWRIWCNTRNGTYGIATLYPTDEKATCGD